MRQLSCLQETVHALRYLGVNVAVAYFGGEVIVVHNIRRNEVEGHHYVFRLRKS